jgi:penicillin-insensitive murein endopeptidase
MDGTFLGDVRRPFFLVCVIIFSGCGQGSSSNTLFSQTDPSGNPPGSPSLVFTPTLPDSTEAMGFYADGSLKNAIELSMESFAHLKIFRLRYRSWATQSLVDTIEQGAALFRTKFPYGDRMQIGDMSSEHGGTLSMHSSHQNGLDADVAYLQTDQKERNPDVWGDSGFSESFVSNGKVTSNFDIPRNWFLLKELVMTGNVRRIFVDEAIKETFCDQSTTIDPGLDSATRTEVLRRLRPYGNHDDHFHMRIACPTE